LSKSECEKKKGKNQQRSSCQSHFVEHADR
jgi:hypothetical protein